MFFSDPDTSFRILAVLDMEWQKNDTQVQPRPFHALSLRLEGNAFFSDAHHSVQSKNGDLLYMPAGSPYYLRSEREHIIVIHFEMSDDTARSFELFSPKNTVVFEDLFRSINETWINKNPGFYYKSMSILYKIFEQMTRQFSPIYAESSYQKIKSAVNYLHLHFTDADLSITKLCEIASLSDTQFRKLFFEVYRTTPLNYINTLRIDYAAELLTGSFFSVEEISAKSGFSDSKHFSTVFKKYKQCSPSTYKKTSYPLKP
ncbi:MAG: helix-turn-helix transcriptional regulator [Lachnospiraceae bacterium]|nr:helix-turn-helix transcriptional regulator [Lachnospiraceae bacterium]